MNSHAQNTDEYLASLPEWQQHNLKLFRTIVHDAAPDIGEEIKWGVPIFMQGKKMLFAMSAFKEHTKFNFIANGATVEDKDSLFNNGFDSKQSRAIDLKEGEDIDRAQLKALVERSLQSIV